MINKAKGGQGRPTCGDLEVTGSTDGGGAGQGQRGSFCEVGGRSQVKGG